MPPVVGRIRKRTTFRALARPDGRATSGPVAVSFSARVRETEAAPLAGVPVVGYAVGRAHGGAVARNRLRRRLRAAVREAAPSLPAGAYLVRAEPTAADLGFGELCALVASAAHGAAAASPEVTRGRG